MFQQIYKKEKEKMRFFTFAHASLMIFEFVKPWNMLFFKKSFKMSKAERLFRERESYKVWNFFRPKLNTELEGFFN